MTSSSTNEFEKHPCEKRLNEIVEKINNKKNKLVVDL